MFRPSLALAALMLLPAPAAERIRRIYQRVVVVMQSREVTR